MVFLAKIGSGSPWWLGVAARFTFCLSHPKTLETVFLAGKMTAEVKMSEEYDHDALIYYTYVYVLYVYVYRYKCNHI